MVDTICLESPFISERVALLIENESFRRQGIDMITGDVFYSITTKELLGTYDSSVRLVVNREVWKSDKHEVTGKVVTYKVPSRPYITVECSVHKLLLGHNCYGGSSDVHYLCKFLISFLEKSFSVDLPFFEDWLVRRIDWAEVYDLGSISAVQEWFRGFNNSTYPRRSCNKYGLTGTYFAGSTTALKFYAKGPEFSKHDRKRLIRFLSSDKIDDIQQKANKLLRVEIEVKARKLKNDFGYIPTVKEISLNYLVSLYEIEVRRVLKEGEIDMKIVRDAEQVEKRLYSLYSSSLAGALLGTWYRFTTLGEEYTKDKISRATFYRHRKQLVDAGVSWHGTDVTLRNSSLIPSDFTPLRKDSRRLDFVDPIVSKLLLKVS